MKVKSKKSLKMPEVIRSRKLKDRQYNGQTKKKPMTYKTLHRKLKIEQHVIH